MSFLTHPLHSVRDLALFQRNIQLFKRFSPDVEQAFVESQPKHIERVQTRAGEDNLKNYKQDQEPQFFYSNYSAQKEAAQWMHDLNLAGYNLLYIYGIGLGHYYDSIKEWLADSRSHYVIFLEDDWEVLFYFLQTHKATEILSHRQIQVYFFQSVEKAEKLLCDLASFFAQCKLKISALKYYEKAKHQTFYELSCHILRIALRIKSLEEEHLHLPSLIFENFYSNLSLLPQSYWLDHLLGQFKNIPAIICGAGPSLNKHFSKLPTLSHKALIFAGGSALNAVNAHGFQPHFGAGLDPYFTQSQRTQTNTAYEVPFFYHLRMHHQALCNIHGPRIFVNSIDNYKITKWIENQLQLKPRCTIQPGFNVVNFCISIATMLGCNPIILVGLDLAYTDQKLYSNGIIAPSHNCADSYPHTILKKDIYGQPIRTLSKWLNEAEWIEQHAKHNPQIQMINATEGGMGIKGIENMPLDTVHQKFLETSYPLYDKIHTALQQSTIQHITPSTIENVLQNLLIHLMRCIDLCTAKLTHFFEIEKQLHAQQEIAIDRSLQYFQEIENLFKSEDAYNTILDVNTRLLFQQLQKQYFEIENETNMLEIEQKKLKIGLFIQKIKAIQDLASLNKQLLEKAINQLTYTNDAKSIALN